MNERITLLYGGIFSGDWVTCTKWMAIINVMIMKTTEERIKTLKKSVAKKR